MNKAPLNDISFEAPGEVACLQCHEIIDVMGLEAFDPVHCPHCGKEFPLPVQFGKYILLDLMGTGGMGAVFKGLDPALKRTVAVKVMQRRLGDNEEFVSQFSREAQMLAALNNPNVVQVYTAGNEQGLPYIVMELVDSGRLDLLIRQQGMLDEKFVVDVAIDVIRGLKAASEIGLAHGDLKPENILFDRKGHAKVVDFGLARFKGETWQPGVIWGTPFFIAPEVARGKQPNLQSDIYNLGGTLYYALTGKHPFDKPTLQETVLARLKEKPPALREVRPDLHPETAAAVERMLEAELLRRYPNYDSLMPDMEVAKAAIARSPVQSSAPKKKKGLPWWVYSSGILLVLLIVFGLTAKREKPQPVKPAPPVFKTQPREVTGSSKIPDVKPLPKPAMKQIVDDASNYAEWKNGSTGGSGFGPWVLQAGPKSGFFVGSSAINAGPGQIDKAGKAWGLYAHSGAAASASRSFEAPLGIATQKFVIDFDHGLISSKGASIGLGLQNVSGKNLWELYFIQGGANYRVRDASGEHDSGIPYSQESLHLDFRLTSSTQYLAIVFAGASTITLKGSLLNESDQLVRTVHLWNFNAGEGSPHDVFFNNMAILEEKTKR